MKRGDRIPGELGPTLVMDDEGNPVVEKERAPTSEALDGHFMEIKRQPKRKQKKRGRKKKVCSTDDLQTQLAAVKLENKKLKKRTKKLEKEKASSAKKYQKEKKGLEKKIKSLAKKGGYVENEPMTRKIKGSKLWFLDKKTQKERIRTVAKCLAELKMRPFLQKDAEGNEIDAGKALVMRGGKALEEDDFSSGVLVLPPGVKKHPEAPEMTEIFYVIGAAPDSLKVQIHGTTLSLGKGDIFFVPPANEYHLENVDETVDIKLFFILLKDSYEEISDSDEDEMDGEE